MPRNLLTALLVVVALCAFACSPRQASVVSGTTAPAPKGAGDEDGPSSARVLISDFRLFSDGSGWVLSERGLYRTLDGGRTWSRIPDGELRTRRYWGGSVRTFFASGSRAWIARSSMEEPTLTTVSRTTDGGETWSATTFRLDPNAGQRDSGGGTRLFFLDDQTGWLLATLTTTSSQSLGLLYGTRDGGNTWTKLDVPIAGDFVFVSATVGWLAGGPATRNLFNTRNGGRTWSERDVPRQGSAGRTTLVALPSFWNEQEGVLPIHVSPSDATSDEDSTLHFYATHDGGDSWTETTGRVRGCCGRPGGAGRLAVVDATTWFLALDDLLVTHDAGNTWTKVDSDRGDLSSAGTISFGDRTHGWAYLENGTCARLKPTDGSRGQKRGEDCSLQTDLLSTSDGGRTWTDITPR